MMRMSACIPLLTGSLMCLLLAGVVFGAATLEVSTLAPKATNESSVPLNNSVVAAVTKDEAKVVATVSEAPCADCNSEEVSKLVDPAAKANYIGNKDIAETIAEEYGKRFESSFDHSIEPSSVDERLRQLSEEVHRSFGSNSFFNHDDDEASPAPSEPVINAAAPSFEMVRPSSTFSVPAFSVANDWTPIAGQSGHTPVLPKDFELGFVSQHNYEHTPEPNRFVKTSVVYLDDGHATGFVHSSNFKYEKSLNPSIQPTAVTMVVSSSGSYDSNEKGYYKQEPDEEPKEEIIVNSDKVETVITNNGTNLLNDTSTSSTVNNVTLNKEYHSVKNLSTIIPPQGAAKSEVTDVELVPSADTNKVIKEVTNSRENEALSKGSNTTRDLQESMSGQTITVSSLVERKGVPKSTTEIAPDSMAASTKLAESVTPKSLPTTTARTRRPSTNGFRRRTTTTSTTSTTSTTTTTEAPPMETTIKPEEEDSMGSESTLDCTTTEGSEEEVTVTPSSNKIITHHSSSSTTTVSKYSTTPTSRMRPRPRIPSVNVSQSPVEETTYTMRSESSTIENVLHSSVDATANPHDEDEEDCDENSPTPDTNKIAPVDNNTIPLDDSTDIPMEVKLYLQLKVATTWEELCRTQEDFKKGLADVLSKTTKKEISPDRVVLLNDHECLEPPPETDDGISVHLYMQDEAGGYDMELTKSFPSVWGTEYGNNTLKITCADVRYAHNGQAYSTAEDGSVIAAIAITGVAAGCFLLLIILMLVMRKRSKRYNYGQRCTPVSLDAYSLDSVSVYNSVRRKAGALRASKRSYGNPNFEDGESPSHQMNFAGLANCLNDTKALHEEFSLVPVVHARLDELPPGAETKNRYANVIPLPETRVPMTKRGSDPLSEYINANYVRGPKNAPRYYIACQAPLESTVSDFWRMIWEQQSKVILMLTDLEENGVEKCADYLPPSEVLDCHRLFGDFHVTLKKREERDKYVISTIQLKNMETNLWREVTHLWYFGWPAQGVPDEANSVIAFIIEARAFMKSNSGPTVVHCSPGTGRTGTIITADVCIRDFEKSRAVDVPKVVHRLRRDRAGAVQTKEQYLFIYQILNLYAAKLTGGAMESL